MAALIRTSTLDLQDPVASYRRQLRSVQAWLPPGWYIAAIFADVESGGLDIEHRGQTESWRVLTSAGLDRDGGIADLLAEAASPEPRFAVVACEDIERASRDTYNSLKVERQLNDNGIALFAADEPASVEGVNPTMILVRRVKQGVAEWYRLQLREKIWKGLREHALDGWNVGTVPYGYLPERHPHPAPAKAAQGRTRHRLAADPDTGPWVTKIFEWRVIDKLALAAIAARLQAAAAPSPNGQPWSMHTVNGILANPKYTGHMVFGRSHNERAGGQKIKKKNPPEAWLWTPEPVHDALIDYATWKEAQAIGRERGRSRDRETPARRNSGAPMRGRIRCGTCKRRRLSPQTATYKETKKIYYACPHDPRDPRQAAAHPGHGRVSLKDTVITRVIAQVLDENVFGPDRAAMLTATLPATAADKKADRDRQAAAIRRQLAKTEASQNALMAELEDLGTDTSPAARAYRARIRDRFTQRQDERAAAQARLAELETADVTTDDPALLDAIPRAAARFTTAGPGIREALYTIFDVQALYRQDKQQVTVWVTLTDATPGAIQALLDDPRTDTGTSTGTNPAPAAPGSPAAFCNPVAPLLGGAMSHRAPSWREGAWLRAADSGALSRYFAHGPRRRSATDPYGGIDCVRGISHPGSECARNRGGAVSRLIYPV